MAYADLISQDQEVLRHLLARAKTWERVHFLIKLITSIPTDEEVEFATMLICTDWPATELQRLNNYFEGVLGWMSTTKHSP